MNALLPQPVPQPIQRATLYQRAALALKLLTSPVDVQPGTIGHALLTGIAPGGYGAIGNPPKRGTREILLAYSEMPWLRALAGRVGDSMAAIQWELYYAKRKGAAKAYRAATVQRATCAQRVKLMAEMRDDLVKVEEHPLLDALDTANTFHLGMSVRKLDAIYLDLVGESFLLIERNAVGMPMQFWPIPPWWIMTTPTPISPWFRISYRGYQATIPATEVLWKVDLDPENPYGRGSGLAQTLGDELETDEYAAKHTKAMFYNQAKPDVLISVAGLQKEDTKRLELDWNYKNQGYMKAYKTHFLNRDVKVTQFDTNDLRAMQFVQVRQFERDTCMQVWGVSPEIFGVLANSNRATIDSADYFFNSKVVVPRAEFSRAFMQERLVPQYDERLILHYVSPVQEDNAFKLEVLKVAPWTQDVDEIRKLAGTPPLDGERGKVFAIPFQYTMQRDLESASSDTTPLTPTILPSSTTPRPIDAVPAGGSPSDVPAGADDGTAKAYAPSLRRETALDRLASRLEPRMRRAFLDAARNMRSSIDLEALARALERRQITQVEAAMQIQRLQTSLGYAGQVATQAFQQAGALAATDLTNALGVALGFDFTNPRAVSWAANNAARMVREISDGQRSAIRALVTEAFDAGIPVRDLARELREVVGLTESQGRAVQNFRRGLVDDGLSETAVDGRTQRYADAQLRRRAETIARTEVLGASNEGQQELWRQASDSGLIDGDRTKRVWIVTPDDRLDTSVCEPMEDQERGLEEPFETGDGRSVMVPPAHPNCRCTTGLRFAKR